MQKEASEDKLQVIIEIERQLNEIQDVDVLLERILTETRRIVNADAGGMQAANSGSGCRLMHNQGAFLDDLLYIAQRGTPNVPGGIALYGTVDDHKLTLEGGKTYHLTLKSAQWDSYPASGSNRSLRAQILTEAAVDAETGDM